MSNITTTQLSAYLDGDLSDSESTNIERELQSSEDLQRELESLRRAREWIRNYPGREPSESVWENFLGETLGAEHEPDAGRGTVVRRGPFAWLAGLRWQAGPALARAWVAVLITLAVGGMGRSVFLQMRTNELSEANAARDAELVRIFSNANWQASAGHLRGHNGQSYSLMCPAYGRAGTVWGTGVYTDDSSLPGPF